MNGEKSIKYDKMLYNIFFPYCVSCFLCNLRPISTRVRCFTLHLLNLNGIF